MHQILFTAFVLFLTLSLWQFYRDSRKKPVRQKLYDGEFEVDLDSSYHVVILAGDRPVMYLDKRTFFSYVEDHGLNEWLEDHFDGRQFDGHGQKSGYYTMDQYFAQTSPDDLKNDVILFLKHFPNYKNVNYGESSKEKSST